MNTHKLTEGIYYSDQVAETDRPLLGLVTGSEGAIVVDAGTSPSHAREFLAAIEELSGIRFSERDNIGNGRRDHGGKSDRGGSANGSQNNSQNGSRSGVKNPPIEVPIHRQFITHWHWDHIFGMQAIGATSLAHELTAEKVEELRALSWDDAGLDKLVESGFFTKFVADCLKTEMPSPEERQLIPIDRTFRNAGEIDLGGISCILEHLGGSHTDDSSVVYVPEREVLFLGDCVYGRRYNGAYGYRLETLVPMRDRLKNFKASHYLISHEAIHSAEELFGFLDTLVQTGEMVGDTVEYQEAAQRYRSIHGSSPNQEIAEMVRFFTGPNAALAR